MPPAVPSRSVGFALTMLTTGLFLHCTTATEHDITALQHTTEPYVFGPRSGDSVEAVRGQFIVPENRDNPDSRPITLTYVRFPSTIPDPGSPIVYLAGGPGGSGISTARGRRFPLFMALREIGDVIAFDQRGTGESNEIPECEPGHDLPLDQPASLDVAVQLMGEAAAECVTFWRDAGVDLSGYNTMESARDLDALRRVLGEDQVSLWGISYGTHLALAAVKVMEDRIDRMVLASAEGLHQTVKLPAETDAYFDRLQDALNQHPVARQQFPDIKAMMRRVLDRLEDSPVTVELRSSTDSITLAFGADEVRLVTGFSISDPDNAINALRVYQAADAGDFTPMARAVYRFLRSEPISFSGMSEAMDVASGISAGRLRLVEEQARSALLGNVLNYPMPHLRSAFGPLDLGDEFRRAPESDIPTLLLSGTLDGRTYPVSQLEAVAGLSNLTHVLIHNAGHNLFMVSPEVTDVILSFMRGEEVARREISVELPDLGR